MNKKCGQRDTAADRYDVGGGGAVDDDDDDD